MAEDLRCGSCARGCFQDGEEESGTSMFVPRSGGRFVKKVAYEFVGEGQGEFDQEEQRKDSKQGGFGGRGFCLLGAAGALLLLIALMVVLGMGGAESGSDADRAGVSNATAGTDEPSPSAPNSTSPSANDTAGPDASSADATAATDESSPSEAPDASSTPLSAPADVSSESPVEDAETPAVTEEPQVYEDIRG